MIGRETDKKSYERGKERERLCDERERERVGVREREEGRRERNLKS